MTGTLHKRPVGNGVLLVEIDNPPMNAMNSAMLRLLSATMAEIAADTSVRAVVITGRGRAFCSGADLKEAAREANGEDLAGFGHMLAAVTSARPAVIAAINGHCVGGGFELALCCDIRIAAPEAKFVCAGVNVGLMASTYRLPRLIGVSRAKEMLLTGLPYTAATAEAWGVITQIHPADQLRDAALALAERIASRAPLAVEAAKRVTERAVDMAPDDAAAMLKLELALLRTSRDHHEAVAAFVAKRQPRFERR